MTFNVNDFLQWNDGGHMVDAWPLRVVEVREGDSYLVVHHKNTDQEPISLRILPDTKQGIVEYARGERILVTVTRIIPEHAEEWVASELFEAGRLPQIPHGVDIDLYGKDQRSK